MVYKQKLELNSLITWNHLFLVKSKTSELFLAQNLQWKIALHV